MAINFPINPSSGDTYVVNNITFTYNAANSAWTSNQNVDSTGTSVVVSDTPPPTPSAGDLWTNSVDMSLNIYYVDTTSSQWVDLNQTDIDLSGYDTSTQVDTKISNVSVDLSAYDTSVQVDTKIAAIPDTDLSAYDTSVQVDTKIAAIPDTDLSAYDTSAQVDIKVASIVDSAPETLNTLNELAAALGDDANHVSTMTTLVGTKADQSTTYTKTEVDTSLNLKSDKTTTYTKTEVDTSLNLKSDKTTTYTKTEVDSAVLSNWTEDANGHILPNVNDTHDIGSSTLKVRDIYMSGSTIHLGDQSISADADGIKMPAIKIGTGANAVSLSASSDGKLVQTATVGGVVQTPTSSTGASVIVSDTPPSSPSSGDLWTDSTTMKMFIYYEDADSSQWVGVSGSSGADGSIGLTGPVGPSGGLSVHLTPLDLPTTGSTGDQAYVESNTSIYVYDENITGWYRVALINATPTFTSTPDASYSFATDGTPIVVTPVAVDPEGALVTYSVIGDMGTVATMTQDDNAFTFTPSTDDANAGEFNITFRVTDGTNVSDAISNFTLTFNIDYVGFYINRTSGTIVEVTYSGTGIDNLDSTIDSMSDGDVLLLNPGEYEITPTLNFDGYATLNTRGKSIAFLGNTLNPPDVKLNLLPNGTARDNPLFFESAGSLHYANMHIIRMSDGTAHTNYSGAIKRGTDWTTRATSGYARNCIIDLNGLVVSFNYDNNGDATPIVYLINCSFVNYSSWQAGYSGNSNSIQVIDCAFDNANAHSNGVTAIGQFAQNVAFDGNYNYSNSSSYGHLKDISTIVQSDIIIT